MKNTNQVKGKQRYGVFYKSNGKWSGPYQGMTMTKYTSERKSVLQEIKDLKNYVLKAKVKIMPVG
jgi:hypothetical protein